jgi:rubrerythrin
MSPEEIEEKYPKDAGHNDWDVTEPLRALTKTGEIDKSGTAIHSVASFNTMPAWPPETKKRVIRLWLWANQAGILGPPREEFEGQQVNQNTPLTFKYRNEQFVLPTIKKNLNFIKKVPGKEDELVSGTFDLPVLNSGKQFSPLPSYQRDLMEMFQESDWRKLSKTSLGNYYDIFNKLKKLGLSDERLKQLQEWLKSEDALSAEGKIKAETSVTVGDLLNFLDFKQKNKTEDQRVDMLKSYEHLSDSRKERLQKQWSSIHTAHRRRFGKKEWECTECGFVNKDKDDRCKQCGAERPQGVPKNPYLFGGWDAQKIQPERATCTGMTAKQREELSNKWFDKFRRTAKGARINHARSLAGMGGINDLIAAEFAGNEELDITIANWLSLNYCHPRFGLGRTTAEVMAKDPNVEDKDLNKAQYTYCLNMVQNLAQRPLGDKVPPRRLRAKEKASASLQAPVQGDEGETESGAFVSQKGYLGKQTAQKETKTGRRGQLELSKWLHMQRPGDLIGTKSAKEMRAAEAQEKQSAARMEAIANTSNDLYNQYLEKTGDEKAAAEYAAQNLADELKKRNIPHDEEAIGAVTAKFKKELTMPGADVIKTAEEEEDEIEAMKDLTRLIQQGTANVVLPNGHEIQITIQGIKTSKNPQGAMDAIKKHFSDRISDVKFYPLWAKFEEKIYGVSAPQQTQAQPNPQVLYQTLKRMFVALKQGKGHLIKPTPGTPEFYQKLNKMQAMLTNTTDMKMKMEVDALVNHMKQLMVQQGLQVEMVGTGVVMGSPPYSKSLCKAVGPDAQIWGAPGVGCQAGQTKGPIQSKATKSKDNGPIQNWTKKKSLKEYLEKKRLHSYRERLEKRVHNAQLDTTEPPGQLR